jgi:2-haloacid dehalogenase
MLWSDTEGRFCPDYPDTAGVGDPDPGYAPFVVQRRTTRKEGVAMMTITPRSRARSGADFPGNLTTVVFELLTVVDEKGTIAAETADVFGKAGLDRHAAEKTAERWVSEMTAFADDVRLRREPWRTSDELRREALFESLDPGEREALGERAIAALALVGHRLRPWPDAVAAVNTLADGFTVVALTDANLSQAVDLCCAAGLRWHCLLVADSVRTFRPDPAMYRLATERLQLDPVHTLYASAQPWDLDVAAEHGYRTAFVRRPGAAEPDDRDEFDLRVGDLAELAKSLLGTMR